MNNNIDISCLFYITAILTENMEGIRDLHSRDVVGIGAQRYRVKANIKVDIAVSISVSVVILVLLIATLLLRKYQ